MSYHSTTQIMSDVTKTVRFHDLFDNQDSNWCDVEINVKHLLYQNGNNFYDITYTYTYSVTRLDDSNSDDDDEMYRTNPFYYKNSIITSDMLDGVIVAKNSLTDELVKYLLMDNEELDQYIGNAWCVQYRANLMFMLAFMWD